MFTTPALRFMLLILACALIVAKAQGQTEPTAVASGISVHVVEPRAIDTVVYQRWITRAGKDSMSGTRTVVSRIVRGADDTRLLEVEQRFPAGRGEIVDTAVAELATLRAVTHRSHQPAKTMRFEFVGGDAHGSVDEIANGKDSVTSVHQSLGGPIFDSNVIDLVVASLPLDRGFSAELPFFIYERGGRVRMTIAVRDRVSVDFPNLGKRDTWIVGVAVPGAPATVWVDAKTHAVLQVRYDIAARGVSFTDTRLTPLRG
jgi:hypothetical protein